MSIRFGVSPIAWVNDDMPELGAGTALETILADARDIGFAGVELGGIFPRDAAVLKPLLDGYGLDLVGGWFSGALLAQDVEAEIAAAQDHLALLTQQINAIDQGRQILSLASAMLHHAFAQTVDHVGESVEQGRQDRFPHQPQQTRVGDGECRRVLLHR
jgi:sugar phosphate isomerase/epimerase